MTELKFMDAFATPEHEAWRRLVEKALKGADFDRRLVSRSADGIRIEPLYSRPHRPAGQADDMPGAAPFTRGTGRQDPLGPWDIRQRHAGTDPAAVNQAVIEDLEGGATSITLAIAGPGRVGLAGDEATLARALEGVLLDVCPIALDAGEDVAAAAAALEAVWLAAGIAPLRRLGALNADPFGTLARQGVLARGLDRALGEASGLARAHRHSPGVTALVADGHVYHAAGASEAQELAAVLATLVAYLRRLEADGMAPLHALAKIAVNLAVDADQMMGIAKLRAARRLVWQVAEACGAGAAVADMTFTAETAVRMMARHDPWVNMLRTTIACASAAFGGAHAITVLPFSVAIGQPDAFARRMARNTQIVLQAESGLGRVADPAGGAYAIERLTSDLALKAWSLFQEIEAEGGMAAALHSGHLQDMIAATAAERARDVATGRLQLTGVSAFPRLGADTVTAEPWPAPAAMPAATAASTSVRQLPARRLAEPFEGLRDRAAAQAARNGKTPTIVLACLGELAGHGTRATWMTNFLAAGGIAAEPSAPLLTAADVHAAAGAWRGRIVCLCASDDDYARLGAQAVAAVRAGGAASVLVAGRPKGLEDALRSAGAADFIAAGGNMLEMLGGLHGELGVA